MLSINKIKQTWNSIQFSNFKKADFLIEILPDIYKSNLTPHDIYREYHNSLQELLSKASPDKLNNFLGGNRREQNGKFYYGGGAVNFTNHLHTILLSDDSIIYVEGEGHDEPITAAESMIRNISVLVKNDSPTITNKHPLFTNSEEVLSEDVLYDSTLLLALHKLIATGTTRTLSYSIFLMLLVSIFQHKIVEFKRFYSDDTIENEIKNISSKNNIFQSITLDINNSTFKYFTDSAYMNTYNVYAFKPLSDEKLYNTGKLTMELTEKDTALATLIFQDILHSPQREGQSFKKKYYGTPIFSIVDNVVFTIFTNVHGICCILCFAYDHFNYAEMYYRTGLLISSYPKARVPMIQKVAITLKDLDESEQEFIKGILKLSSDKIIISEQQLRAFLESFKDELWMDEFKKTMLPFIENHLKSYYVFSENEILSYTLSNLSDLDRIKIINALKSLSDAPDSIDCKDLEMLHKLFH